MHRQPTGKSYTGSVFKAWKKNVELLRKMVQGWSLEDASPDPDAMVGDLRHVCGERGAACQGQA